MTKKPWTDPDPQPGDLDAELALLDESAFEYREGDPSATLRIVVSVEGADASRLARIAETRGQKPSDVVAELLRDAHRQEPISGVMSPQKSSNPRVWTVHVGAEILDPPSGLLGQRRGDAGDGRRVGAGRRGDDRRRALGPHLTSSRRSPGSSARSASTRALVS